MFNTCEACVYFDPIYNDGEFESTGYCVSSPPQVFKMLHEQFAPVYPCVSHDQRACRFFSEESFE